MRIDDNGYPGTSRGDDELNDPVRLSSRDPLTSPLSGHSGQSLDVAHAHDVADVSALYGIMAEFIEADEVVVAASAARKAGYRRMDAYTPFPIHGLDEALGFRDFRLPWLIFFGGLGGMAFGYLLQYYVSVVDYPLNVGGKPLHSWPQMIPIAYESTILFAALTAVFGMIWLNGLPRFYHPVFNARNFDRASQDRFFLCIEQDDKQFDRDETLRFLVGQGAVSVSEVAK